MTRAYACRRDLLVQQTVDVGGNRAALRVLYLSGGRRPVHPFRTRILDSWTCPDDDFILGTEEPRNPSVGRRVGGGCTPPSVCASAASSDVSERHRSGVRRLALQSLPLSHVRLPRRRNTQHTGQTDRHVCKAVPNKPHPTTVKLPVQCPCLSAGGHARRLRSESLARILATSYGLRRVGSR